MNGRFYYCAYPALRSALNGTTHTRETLARSVGISASNVWWWLTGGNERTLRTIDAILAETGLTYEEAFRRSV